jgi:diguanylate cyclase (GGDEF)-like protein/PAS domain S-box-containing protein
MGQPAEGSTRKLAAFGEPPGSPGCAGVRSLLLALVVTALAFLASRGLRAMAGQVAPIWLSDAVLLAQMMVARSRQRRYWVLAGGVLGALAANLLVGRSLALALRFTSGDIIEVLIAFAFSPRVSTIAELIRPISLARFLSGGVLLAPVLSGILVTVLTGGHLGNYLLPTLVPWFISDALSLTIVTPLAVVFWTGEVTQLLRGSRRTETFLLLLLVCVVTAGVFGQNYVPLLYWTLVPVVLIAFRVELAGVLVGLLLCFAIALWCTTRGWGPLWFQPFGDMHSRIFALQLFFVAALGIALPISVIQMQRKRMMALLRDGERQYRILAENASDVVMSMALDGKLVYVSPRARAVLGCNPDDLVGVNYPQLILSDDRHVLATAIESVSRGEREPSRISRFQRPDGEVVWLETCLRVVLDPLSGKPESLTATARDITERKFAEEQHADERRELQGLAFRDSLTGLFNRRYFDRELKLQWEQAARAGNDSVAAVVMVDVDAFKSYNDHYGHQRGDECLRTVAQAIASSAAHLTDRVARYGGEEFALVLEDTDWETALAVAESVRQDVERLRIPHPVSAAGIVTVSLGVAAQRPGDSGDASGLVAAADRALYSAKRLGRNQTCIATQAP